MKKESRESDKRDKDECTEIPIQGSPLKAFEHVWVALPCRGDDGQQEQDPP